MKTEIPLAIIMNVPWKSAQPVFAESRPEQQPDACDNQATNKNESAQVVHGSWNKITLRSGFSTPTHCLAVICAGERQAGYLLSVGSRGSGVRTVVARVSRPCVGCTVRTGGTPVPLLGSAVPARNFIWLSTCRACEWLNTYRAGWPALGQRDAAKRDAISISRLICHRCLEPQQKDGSLILHASSERIVKLASSDMATIA